MKPPLRRTLIINKLAQMRVRQPLSPSEITPLPVWVLRRPER